MPTIPDPAQIKRVIPSGQRVVSSVQNAGTPALALAESTNQIANAVIQHQENKAVHAYNSAKSGFLVDNLELKGSFDRDQDHETMVDRYEKEARNKAGEYAQSIPSARRRAEFMDEIELRIAQSRGEIKDLAWGVERDKARANIQDQLTGLRELVIRGDGETAMDTARALVESARETDYLGEAEGQKVLEQFRVDSARGWIESLAPDERLDALKSPFAKNLPTDVRNALTRQAEELSFAQTAADTVDEYFGEGLDRDEMIEKSSKIKDVRLREEVERRYDNRLADREAATIEKNSDLHEKYFLQVRLGNLTVDQMMGDPVMKADLESMSPTLQNNLFVAESQANGRAPKRSDPSVIDTLHMYNESKDWLKLREHFIENAHLLSASDFNTWSQRSWDGSTPDEYKGLFTSMQTLKSRLSNIYSGNSLDEAESVMTEKLTDWHLRVYEQTGKEPTDSDVTKKIDQMLIEIHDPGWFNGNDRLFELTDQEVDDRLDNFSEAEVDKVLTKYPNITRRALLGELGRASE